MQLELENETDVRVLLRAVRNQLKTSRRFNKPEHAEARDRLATFEKRLLELLPRRGLHSV